MIKRYLGKGWRWLRRWLLLGVLAGVLVSVLLVLLFRWLDPPGSAVIVQRLLSEGGPQRFAWVDMQQISPSMALAVVAAEDQRFASHAGFDTDAIIAALEDHLDGGRLRGASTITQQVARNLFLWQGRSFVRKGLEAWFTVLLEALWSKRRILEVYLNIAQTGERMFGVAAASERYFARPASALDASQAALIAAVLPNPVRFRVEAPSAYVRQRQRWILRQMDNLGGSVFLAPVVSQ